MTKLEKEGIGGNDRESSTAKKKRGADMASSDEENIHH